MTHDPYKLCSDVTCPHCGVKGRLVSEQETRYFDDESEDFELLTCVECGGLHESHGFSGDEHLKVMRIQFGRLIEGRPYEPPKPKERDPNAKPMDLGAYDSVLKDVYANEGSLLERSRAWASLVTTMPGYSDRVSFKDVDLATEPTSFTVANCTVSPVIPLTRSNAAWNFTEWAERVGGIGDWGDDGDPTE